MKTLRETNTSQRFQGNTSSRALPSQPADYRVNVSQYYEGGSDLKEFENAVSWGKIAQEAAKTAVKSSDKAAASEKIAKDSIKIAQDSIAITKANADKSETLMSGLDETFTAIEAAKNDTVSAKNETLAFSDEVKDLAREMRTGVMHVEDLAAQTDTSENNAKASEDASFNYRNQCEQLAIGDTESAKFWANRAMESVSFALGFGGLTSPKSGSEYPTTTAVSQSSIFFVDLDEPYRFTTGTLSGKTCKSQDIMLYEIGKGEWSLIPSVNGRGGGVGTITSVNGQKGPEVILGADDVNALPLSGGSLSGPLSLVQTVLSSTDDKKLKVEGYNGEATFGPTGGNYEIHTDLSMFDFNKELSVNGSKVYNESFKPSPSDLGVIGTEGGDLTGKLSMSLARHGNFIGLKAPGRKAFEISSKDGSFGIYPKVVGWKDGLEYKYEDSSWSINGGKIYTTVNKPTPAEIGVYSNEEIDAKFQATADWIMGGYEETNVKGKTVFSAYYDLDKVDVLYNGVELSTQDYIANDGHTIKLKLPVKTSRDVIKIKSYKRSRVGDLNGTNLILSPSEGSDSIAKAMRKKVDKNTFDIELAKKASLDSVNNRVRTTGDTITGSLVFQDNIQSQEAVFISGSVGGLGGKYLKISSVVGGTMSLGIYDNKATFKTDTPAFSFTKPVYVDGGKVFHTKNTPTWSDVTTGRGTETLEDVIKRLEAKVVYLTKKLEEM